MKFWLSLFAFVLLPCGVILVGLELLRRHMMRDDDADYVDRIQILKADLPMALPAIQPLRGIKVPVPVKPRRRRSKKPVSRPTAVEPERFRKTAS